MVFSLEYLHYWKHSLDNFGQQRVGVLSKKTWNDYIKEKPEVSLWGVSLDNLSREIKQYEEKPAWQKLMLKWFTSIGNKQTLWHYYTNCQAFAQRLSSLTPTERETIHQPYQGELYIQQQNQGFSPTRSFKALFKRFWQSLGSRNGLSVEDSKQKRENAFNSLLIESNQLYKNHQQRLRVFYQQPHVQQEAAIAIEQQLFQERQKAFEALCQQLQKADLGQCDGQDKKQFGEDANELFIKSEKIIHVQLAEIAFAPARPVIPWLQKRFLQDNTLSLIPASSPNLVVPELKLSDKFLDEENVKNKLDKIYQQLSVNLPPQQAIYLFGQYYQLSKAYLLALGKQGQQAIFQAKQQSSTFIPTQRINFLSEICQEMEKKVEKFYRQVTRVIHPDKARNYHLDVRQCVNDHFKLLGQDKDEQIHHLQETSVTPESEREILQTIIISCEKMEQQNVILAQEIDLFGKQTKELAQGVNKLSQRIEKLESSIKSTEKLESSIEILRQEFKHTKELIQNIEIDIPTIIENMGIKEEHDRMREEVKELKALIINQMKENGQLPAMDKEKSETLSPNFFK